MNTTNDTRTYKMRDQELTRIGKTGVTKKPLAIAEYEGELYWKFGMLLYLTQKAKQ